MPKKYLNPGPIKFDAVVRSTGVGQSLATFVSFPHDLKQTYGVGNLVPIKATFDNRVVYQGSLAKMGGDHAMLLIRKDIREQIGKGPGEKVRVIVDLDDKPRVVKIAKDVKDALKESDLLKQFELMAYTHRKEYVQWIESAKKPETRTNRIKKMREELSKKFSK